MTETFEAVEVPMWQHDIGAKGTVAQIDGWLGSRPLTVLVKVFGGDVADASPDARANYLDAFAAANWDFRRGQERDTADRVDIDAELGQLVVSAASALGLVDSHPPRRSAYDAILILGGLIRACIVRPRYAAELIRTGTAVGEVVALGAFRRLSDPERELAARLEVAAADEFDAMTAGIRAAFSHWLVEPPSVRGKDIPGDQAQSWRIVEWSLKGSANDPRRASIIAAPTKRPDAVRANTAETYEFWATELKDADIQSALIITNPIYVPYQGCVAIEALGMAHDLDIETVGISRLAADLGGDTQPFGPQEYLQEIRSAIGAMARLRPVLVSAT